MSETEKFQQVFGELCDWFENKDIPLHEGFLLMASAVGAIIAQLPDEKRKEAVELAHVTIGEALKAAAAA